MRCILNAMPDKDSIALSDIEAHMAAVEAEYRKAEEAIRKAEEARRQAEAKRDELQTALRVFQGMLANRSQTVPARAAQRPLPAPAVHVAASPPKPSKPPTAPELAIPKLEAHGDWLTLKELLDMLGDDYKPQKATGSRHDALYGSLWHEAKKENGRIVNREGKWGLREWLQEGEPL